MSMKKWLGQTQETAWLPTQEIGTTAVIRERYPTPLNGGRPLTPSLALATTFNFSGSSLFPLTARINVGVLIFHAHYSFRLRKDLTSNPFADRTLLFERSDGTRHFLKLEKEEVEELYQRRLAKQEEDSTKLVGQSTEKELIEAKPLDMTKSVLMANIQELFSAQQAAKYPELTE
jgi:hypothetical protein